MANHSDFSNLTDNDDYASSSSASDDGGIAFLTESSSNEDPILPILSWQDIRVGRVLGKGAFSKVKKVSLRSSNKDKGHSKQKYAIKYLRNSTMERKDIFLDAAVDLAIEGQFLAYLNHENIVQIHAQGCLTDAYKNDNRYFLVLDRLDGTLDGLLEDWRLSGMPYYIFPDSALMMSLEERIKSIALPVARAMEYLHSYNIVFRDLKPFNIGLYNGTVKLFDFGLARIAKEDLKLTGRVGSPLYMAPEVVLSQDYGLPVDVYSYAIMLWELLTVEVPFVGMKRSELERAVVRENRRPKLDKNCGSPQIQDLISRAWDQSPDSRPTFSSICEILEKDVGISGEKHYSSSEREVRTGSRARAA